jgi:hypothetical protein
MFLFKPFSRLVFLFVPFVCRAVFIKAAPIQVKEVVWKKLRDAIHGVQHAVCESVVKRPVRSGKSAGVDIPLSFFEEWGYG